MLQSMGVAKSQIRLSDWTTATTQQWGWQRRELFLTRVSATETPAATATTSITVTAVTGGAQEAEPGLGLRVFSIQTAPTSPCTHPPIWKRLQLAGAQGLEPV